MKPIIILVLFLSASPVSAEKTPLRWDTHTQVPDVISTASVAGAIGLDVFHVIRDENDFDGWWRLGCRNGMALLVPQVLKLAFPRWRPDHSDQESFPSQHTALAAASARSGLGIGLTVTTAWGRVAAGKHHVSDVAVGAGAGFLAQKVCR